MKKAIVGSLCYLMITASWAQQKVSIPVHCVPLAELEQVLDEYDEIPFIRGKSVRETQTGTTEHPMVLFMNTKDRSWTLVEKVGEKAYCVLAVGVGLEPVPASIVDDVVKQRQKNKS